MTTSLSRAQLELAIQSWLPELSEVQLEAVYGMLHAFVKPALQQAEAIDIPEELPVTEPTPEEIRESMFSRISRIVNPPIEPKDD